MRWRTVGLCLISSGLLLACSKELSVEQQVISTIRNMEASIEEGERRPFMASVAEDFTGQGAIMTRSQVNALILIELRRHQRIQARFMPIRVTPTGPGEAEAYFNVLLTGGAGWLPDSGQVFSFVSRWKEDDGEWLLASAQWQAVDVDQLLN